MNPINKILSRWKDNGLHAGAVVNDLQNRFDSMPKNTREERLLAMVIQKEITITKLSQIVDESTIELEVWRDHYYSFRRNKPAQVRSDVYGEHREFSANRTQRTGMEF